MKLESRILTLKQNSRLPTFGLANSVPYNMRANLTIKSATSILWHSFPLWSKFNLSGFWLSQWLSFSVCFFLVQGPVNGIHFTVMFLHCTLSPPHLTWQSVVRLSWARYHIISIRWENVQVKQKSVTKQNKKKISMLQMKNWDWILYFFFGQTACNGETRDGLSPCWSALWNGQSGGGESWRLCEHHFGG